MELNITGFETAIKNYLDNRAKEDKAFAEAYAKPNKSISECCKYIYQEVEKSRKNNEKCVGVASEEIFGLAVHYYDEDNIVVDGPKNKVETVTLPPEVSEKKRTAQSKKKAKEIDPDVPAPLEIPLF